MKTDAPRTEYERLLEAADRYRRMADDLMAQAMRLRLKK